MSSDDLSVDNFKNLKFADVPEKPTFRIRMSRHLSKISSKPDLNVNPISCSESSTSELSSDSMTKDDILDDISVDKSSSSEELNSKRNEKRVLLSVHDTDKDYEEMYTPEDVSKPE